MAQAGRGSHPSSGTMHVWSSSKMPKMVPVGMPASTLELPSSGSNTAVYLTGAEGRASNLRWLGGEVARRSGDLTVWLHQRLQWLQWQQRQQWQAQREQWQAQREQQEQQEQQRQQRQQRQ